MLVVELVDYCRLAHIFTCQHILRELIEKKTRFSFYFRMPPILNILGDYNTLVSIGKKIPEKLFVVDFFGSWCGPCKTLGAQFPNIAAENPDVVFAKCDIDDNKELAAFFNITSVPHVKFFKYKNDQLLELGTVTGLDIQGIKNKIAQFK